LALDPHGVLQQGLQSVHFEQAPYATQYPTLKNILSDRPGAPKNIVLQNNAVLGGRATMIDAQAQPFVQIKTTFGAGDVVFANAMPDSARQKLADFQLAPSSPALQQGFKAAQAEPVTHDN